ncbi:MAG: Adenylosuccinate lyase [Parcubacteria group bacterium GW2011_GWA2_43_13]|nr:MAG: Adenylosuccinate lyase [Parcubacteria group bacterium GW2011_GWA2_43_13]OGY68519.1 MAG: adenylosuccinate lyase [Candidatus Jacksonbacteria bacterium RIFCSPHIGHO2_02_FULL_43_10]OGY70822.1 MAG: adenylosuccinate lyase [Candidatus Jacksonbacteria bacterium RIFCSPLOWO2_01_FULL_44_13]HAZ17097.1 adenylosuccinate lyase [Candidatus Jacksonbacteria bacterium]
MIARYIPTQMASIWTLQSQFRTWLEVELAVIQARCNLGLYRQEVSTRITAVLGTPEEFMTSEMVEAIIERDREIEHDLQAFVDIVRRALPEDLRHFIHDGLTSFDTEVPALALQFRQVSNVIMPDLAKFIAALRTLASRHMFTYRMGLTHGQDAKPTTFGWLVCSYIEMMEGAQERLINSFERIEEVKCSGAVGNYETLSPELEVEVCRLLGLRVRRAATQIVSRDVFANLLSDMATAGGGIERIATDFRLLATSPFGEVQEPRKQGQKGSSAMPHKSNTTLLERMSGMAKILRGYAVMGNELVSTWLERDIAHSCVERIAFPDATCLFDYMLQRMTWIVENLEVNRKAMAEGINRSRGCWASEEVKLLLERRGIEPDTVYRMVQSAAFMVVGTGREFRDVLLEAYIGDKRVSKLVSREELNTCFNFVASMCHLQSMYARFNLDPSLALSSNV